MEHCCRWGSHDVPSWRLRLRAGPRIRVAGRAHGTHGACGKAVAAAGRGAQAEWCRHPMIMRSTSSGTGRVVQASDDHALNELGHWLDV